jgi:hypothetical protein
MCVVYFLEAVFDALGKDRFHSPVERCSRLEGVV